MNKAQVYTKLNNIFNRKNENHAILKQQALEHMETHHGYLPVYTDGSKSNIGVGFSVVCEKFRILSSLPPYASVYRVKLFCNAKCFNQYFSS